MKGAVRHGPATGARCYCPWVYLISLAAAANRPGIGRRLLGGRNRGRGGQRQRGQHLGDALDYHLAGLELGPGKRKLIQEHLRYLIHSTNSFLSRRANRRARAAGLNLFVGFRPILFKFFRIASAMVVAARFRSDSFLAV